MELLFKDYLRLPSLVKIAEFAEKAEKAIKENYSNSFSFNNKEIPVYSSTLFGEHYCSATLTSRGMWKFHDESGHEYEIVCEGEEIFRHFAKQLTLKEKGEENEVMDSALREFKSWVRSLPNW